MKKRTEWEKKKSSYLNTKHKKLNNKLSPSFQDKNSCLVNQSVKKLFEPIINSIHLKALTIKNKNKQIKQNLKEISKLQTQIQNKKNRQLHKKEEIVILQEKIKQKQKNKTQITTLYEPYYNLLEDNNILLTQQIDDLFKKEINILFQEKVLQKLLHNNNLNHNSFDHNLSETNSKLENDNLLGSNNVPICMNSSNHYKDFIDNINKNPQINKRNHMNSCSIPTFQSSQISSITKHTNSMFINKSSNNNKNKICISTTSSFENDNYNKDSNKIKQTSLPLINLNKEQLDIMNKTYLNEEDFSKILSEYKSKNCSSSQNCKTPSQRQSISKIKSTGKESQINDSSFNNSVHTGNNNKETDRFIGNSSFYSQIRIQTPLKVNYLKKKSKGINSSKERLKEFLITENKANFSMCTDDKFIKDGINNSPGNNINKSKSSAIIQDKKNNNIHLNKRIYRHAKSLQKNSIEIKMLIMLNNKSFVSKIKEIIQRNIIKTVIPLILLYVINKKEFVLKIISDNLIKKYYIQKLIEILKECITCYNNRIQMKVEENVEDFFDDDNNENDLSSSLENIKFDNYMDKLNKFKQLTYEMKEMENNMKEFIEQVYDDE